MDQASALSLTLVVGCTVSSLALLCLIVVYALYWRVVRSERAVILINLCVSIISSNGLILLAQTLMQQRAACVATAALLHFTFLASFCWVLAEAWHAYTAVGGRLRRRIIHKRFLLLGWGFPAMTVAFSCGLTKMKGYGTLSYCWLSLEGGLLYSFVGPAAVVVLINMVIGILVFNKLVTRNGVPDKVRKDVPHRHAGGEQPNGSTLRCSKCGAMSSSSLRDSTHSNAMASLWSSCVVLPLLALTWMSAVLAITDRRSALFQVLFSVFDSLQGLVITAVHCFLRREVQLAIRQRLRGCQGEVNDCSVSLPNGHSAIMGCEKSSDGTCTADPSKEALIGPAFPVLHHPHRDGSAAAAVDGAQEGDDDGGGGADGADGSALRGDDDVGGAASASGATEEVVAAGGAEPADGETGTAAAESSSAASPSGEDEAMDGPDGEVTGTDGATEAGGGASGTAGSGGEEAAAGSGSKTGSGVACRGQHAVGSAAPARPTAPPSLVESVPLLTQRPYTYLGSEGINELQNYCTRRDEGEACASSSDGRSQSSDGATTPFVGGVGTKGVAGVGGGGGGGGVPGRTDTGDTVSNTSESSLERRKSKYSDLDFEKIMHTRKRHKEMLNQSFPDKDSVKVDSEVEDPSRSRTSHPPHGAVPSQGAQPQPLSLPQQQLLLSLQQPHPPPPPPMHQQQQLTQQQQPLTNVLHHHQQQLQLLSLQQAHQQALATPQAHPLLPPPYSHSGGGGPRTAGLHQGGPLLFSQPSTRRPPAYPPCLSSSASSSASSSSAAAATTCCSAAVVGQQHHQKHQQQHLPPPLPLRPPRRSAECERPGAELPLVYQEGDLQTEV